MNTDFRLSVALFTHPKFAKLGRRLGSAGQLAYVRLLAFTAQSKPNGTLSHMDADDIAIAAGYDESAEEFVTVLTDLRLLDRSDDGTLSVHDWAEHNPWAVGAEERSVHAQKAAQARWAKRTQPHGNAGAMQEQCPPQCSEHAGAMPAASSSNAPLLSSPTLTYTVSDTRVLEDTLALDKPALPCASARSSAAISQGAEAAPESASADVRTESDAGFSLSPPAATPTAPAPLRGGSENVKRPSRFDCLKNIPAWEVPDAEWLESLAAVHPNRVEAQDSWRIVRRLRHECGTGAAGRERWDALKARIAKAHADYRERDAYWQRNIVPYLSTWLNGKGWEDDPQTAAMLPPQPVRNGHANGAATPPPPLPPGAPRPRNTQSERREDDLARLEQSFVTIATQPDAFGNAPDPALARAVRDARNGKPSPN